MNISFEGKNVLVTGASTGIGLPWLGASPTLMPAWQFITTPTAKPQRLSPPR
jgi:hypothetical protein